jgi:metal-responsive CopG/Arc/MetJ family transcriptional regulator
MARREVLVQLDDHLVENLDVLARERGLSRSELLRRGAQAILDADALTKADLQLQYSYQSLPQDEAIIEAAARLARETMPLW